MDIGEICEKLDGLLSSRQGDDKVEASVNVLCRIYGVERSEVAIFRLDAAGGSFSFLWPQDMRHSGSIPFTANRSLVAMTAEERRCFLDNSFSSTPHLFVFEAFAKERTAPIQRIMSAPLVKGDELLGVIQVCRKGETDVGLKRFTDPELAALGELAGVIARHL